MVRGAQLAGDTTPLPPLTSSSQARRRAGRYGRAALQDARISKERTCPEILPSRAGSRSMQSRPVQTASILPVLPKEMILSGVNFSPNPWAQSTPSLSLRRPWLWLGNATGIQVANPFRPLPSKTVQESETSAVQGGAEEQKKTPHFVMKFIFFFRINFGWMPLYFVEPL